MSQNAHNEIKINFQFESVEFITIKSNVNEKLINIFKNFTNMKNQKFDSLFFLYNGELIVDFQKTIFELANKESKQNMEINILVYTKLESTIDDDSKINVYILDKENTIKIPCKKEDKIKNITDKYEYQTKFNSKSILYKYKGMELDLEKTFDIFINVYKKTLIYIIFTYLNVQYSIECYKEDKIEDICSDFASEHKINKKKVIFKYKDNIVDQNQTLNQF